MVYPSLRDAVNVITGEGRRRRSGGRRVRVPAAVVLLGVTSMLTDISSEMVAAVLPLYLTVELSFTAFQFGVYEGLSQAVQSVMRLGGGAAADRRSGHKGVALAGYGTSAVTRLAILLTGGAWLPTTAVLLADKAGKGVRSAPRDAMISFASPPDQLGRSFGVHRALDSLGALIGPLVAFAILGALPNSYTTVFAVSFSFALVGVAVLALFVGRHRRTPSVDGLRRAVAKDVFADSSIRRIVVGASMLGLLTVGDAFIFLGFRRVADIRLEFFPLLFTGTAIAYLLLAIPIGRLSDRVGRPRVFVGGFFVIGLVYLALLRPPSGVLGAVVVLGGLGLFYAATDGVLMATASQFLAEDARATGLALVSTGTAVGRFIASIVFGALWSLFGPERAFLVFASVAPIAAIVVWWVMSGIGNQSGDAQSTSAAVEGKT